jgi:hypothetical protein
VNVNLRRKQGNAAAASRDVLGKEKLGPPAKKRLWWFDPDFSCPGSVSGKAAAADPPKGGATLED